MKIANADLKIIPDSRRQETLEAELKSDKFSVLASVPSGKSRGTHEAFALKPQLALKKFEEIKPKILNREFENQEEFDNFLISLDKTPNKQNLGGNLILALSLAFARLKAKNEELELFDYIRLISRLPIADYQLIHPIFNVINGGAHSGYPYQSNPNQSQSKPLDFQEFQIIPEVKDFGLALGLGKEFYEKLGQFLEKKFGKKNVFLGDEAGFSCPFKGNEEAIEIMSELIIKYNYPLRIGLDVAATQFYQSSPNNHQKGFYLIEGKRYSSDELLNFYLKLIKSYKIISIEDPFHEEDFESFAKLTQYLKQNKNKQSPPPSHYIENQIPELLIITDDLTTTNLYRLKTAIEKGAGNTILIKPNQIGTLTETLKVIKLAYENNWQIIVSHRSGETRDDFIADLAKGVNAWGIKAGAPATPERTVKYERILKIQNANRNL